MPSLRDNIKPTEWVVAVVLVFVGLGCAAFVAGALVASFGRDEEHTRELREARARAREHAEGKGE